MIDTTRSNSEEQRSIENYVIREIERILGFPLERKVSESAIHGKSIYDFSSDSKASKAYEELTKEFLKDHREKKKDMER